jgi:hypothetical protein
MENKSTIGSVNSILNKNYNRDVIRGVEKYLLDLMESYKFCRFVNFIKWGASFYALEKFILEGNDDYLKLDEYASEYVKSIIRK